MADQESKKFKRLKKAQRDMDDARSGFSEEEEFDETGRRGRTAEEKLEHSLFGDDEGKYHFNCLLCWGLSHDVN